MDENQMCGLYVRLPWPDYQEYMEHPDFREEAGFDVNSGDYFIPYKWTVEEWEPVDFDDEEDGQD